MKNLFTIQTNKLKTIAVSVFLLCLTIQMEGQVASVEQTLTEVKEKVNRVNQLAENHQIYKSVELLNETRRYFDSYITHYFDEEYRSARTVNSTFAPELQLQFSDKLTAAYWEGRVNRSQRAIENAKEAFAARNYQRTLNAQDKVWSYLNTAFTIANSIKDVTENIITQNYVDAAKSAYDGVNDFIGNYKEIEEARLQIINSDRYEIEVQTLIKRAERMEETNWQFASYMRAYEQDVTDFYRLVSRFNKRVTTLREETIARKSDSDSPRSSERSQSQTEEVEDLSDNQQSDNINKNINDPGNQGSDNDNPQNRVTSGKRGVNSLFHSYWVDARGNKMKLRHNGENVEIDDRLSGQINNGELVYTYTEKDGTERRDKYRLIDDGYTMEVKKEWSEMMIKDHLTILNNFTSPSQQQIAEFRKTNDPYITSLWSYGGSTMARYGDKDGDQVPDDMDNCPNTPQGLTVSNGGVDVSGCTIDSATLLPASDPVTSLKNGTSQTSSSASDAQPTQQIGKNFGVSTPAGQTVKGKGQLFKQVSGGLKLIGQK